jgi:hypothetical protein
MMFFGKKKEPAPTLYTEQACNSCGDKERRPFEQGDYVFKEGVRCKKCNSASTMISAIYGEYPPEKNA